MAIPFLRRLAAKFGIEIGSDDGSGPTISSGSGSPNGVVSAPVGSLYLRTDGGPNTAQYRKETGTGNTGWTANAAGGAGSAITFVGQAVFTNADNTKQSSFVVLSVPGAVVGKIVNVDFNNDVTYGPFDEDEMDSYTLSAYVSAADTVTLRIVSQTCTINPSIQFPIQLTVS